MMAAKTAETSLKALIINKRGLHARASAKFVQLVEGFNCTKVHVTKDNETVGGQSIMGLMLLAAGPGSEITISAQGPRAYEVTSKLKALIDNRFGEDE